MSSTETSAKLPEATAEPAANTKASPEKAVDPAAPDKPAEAKAEPASQQTYSAITRSPLFYFYKGLQVHVPLSDITFTGRSANIPPKINGIDSTLKDPLGQWINHLVMSGKIKRGPLLPKPAAKE